eukprot:TRINITY_DN67743_c8_g1_i1.p1 TRINITY_DN67743_c8_g1~~TRINITY_DN67743_c8_g1_i1.p1  ORF type:complete len:499 (-),score=50.53 TRINITY_DN67743_c8_g1_i1:90-1586(-)
MGANESVNTSQYAPFEDDTLSWIPVESAATVRKKSQVRVSLPNDSGDVCLIHHKDQYYAVDDLCPHKDASLSRGDIEDIGDNLCVRCPKHRKKFAGGLYMSLNTGQAHVKSPCAKFKDHWKVKTYPVQEKDGAVYLGLPKAEGAAAVKSMNEISPKKWGLWKISEIIPRSHDSNVYVFIPVRLRETDSDKPDSKLNPYSWHISMSLKLPDGSRSIEREYTPISDLEPFQKGERVEIIIKLYPDGALTGKLKNCGVGDEVWFSAPQTTVKTQIFTGVKDKKDKKDKKEKKEKKDKKKDKKAKDDGEKYKTEVASPQGDTKKQKTAQEDQQEQNSAAGPLNVNFNPEEVQVMTLRPPVEPYVALMCGGTGIAPMIQLTKHWQEIGINKIYMLDSNHTPVDILLREELAELEAQFNGDVKITHTITKPEKVPDLESCWSGRTGRIDLALMKECLPEPFWKADPQRPASVVFCGPDLFNESLKKICEEHMDVNPKAFLDLEA